MFLCLMDGCTAVGGLGNNLHIRLFLNEGEVRHVLSCGRRQAGFSFSLAIPFIDKTQRLR